jgi:hypothetical protein
LSRSSFIIEPRYRDTIAEGTLSQDEVPLGTVRAAELVREEPFISHNIEMTRQAYGLNRFAQREFPAETTVDAADPANNQPTLQNPDMGLACLAGYAASNAIRNTEVGVSTGGPQSKEHGFTWKSLTLFLLTIGAVVICLLMLRPFLLAITGALVLAIVIQRPHKWITARLKYKALAATTSVMLVSLGIIGPAFFLAQSLRHRILSVVGTVQSGAAARGIQQFLDKSPRVSAVLQYSMGNITLSQAIDKSAGFIAGRLGAVLGGSISAITNCRYVVSTLLPSMVMAIWESHICDRLCHREHRLLIQKLTSNMTRK